MQEPHGESLANCADLESCAGGGGIAGEALTEALRVTGADAAAARCGPDSFRGDQPGSTHLQAVREIGQRYEQGGLERALNDKQRLGAAGRCSGPPKNSASSPWCALIRPRAECAGTVRLIA